MKRVAFESRWKRGRWVEPQPEILEDELWFVSFLSWESCDLQRLATGKIEASQIWLLFIAKRGIVQKAIAADYEIATFWLDYLYSNIYCQESFQEIVTSANIKIHWITQ